MSCQCQRCQQNEALIALLPHFEQDVQMSIIRRWFAMEIDERERILGDLQPPPDPATLTTLAIYFGCDVEDLVRYVSRETNDA